MEDHTSCSECREISRELAEAYIEMWDATGAQARKAWAAVQKMLGGTEEDVERAEQLTQAFHSRAEFDYQYLISLQNTPVMRAWMKKAVHEMRTRHTVPFRKPG